MSFSSMLKVATAAETLIAIRATVLESAPRWRASELQFAQCDPWRRLDPHLATAYAYVPVEVPQ